MGNTQSADYIQYAVPVAPPPLPDATQIFRSSIFPTTLVKELPGEKWDSPWDIFQYRLKQQGFRDKDFLASRLWDSRLQESKYDCPPANVQWLTFGGLEELSLAFARGLMFSKYVDEVEFPTEEYKPGRKLRSLAVMSKNRIEWFVTEFATCVSGITLVPLYDSLGDSALLYILDQTKLTCLAASLESTSKFLKLLDKKDEDPALSEFKVHIKYIILYDRFDQSLAAMASAHDLTLVFWKDIVDIGRRNPSVPLKPQQPEDVGTLCYTSGTTGYPKGVIITARNFAAVIAGHQRCIMAHPGFRTSNADLHISYLPLAHVFERLICANCTALGIRIACFSGDTQKLLDDMRVIQPTVFLSVPRLFMRINDRIVAGLKEKSAVAQFLFKSALESKIKNLRTKGVYTHHIWDHLIFAKIRKLMGGNIKYMLVGGAPLESIIQERMSVLFCCPLLHGFGMTEMGAAFICNPGEKLAGHIGGIQPSNEFCLRSIPEMNYSVDAEAPCGELLVRGYSVTPGYLLSPEQTRSAITQDGWLCTGDVAVLLQGNSVKIIDRKKNIFKLAQGEYVAPERIEGIYSNADMVGQIFVHGESSKPVLVAIVTPDEDAALKWWKEAKSPASPSHQENAPPHDGIQTKLTTEEMTALCQNKNFEAEVMRSMEEAGRLDLKGFEKVKSITLVPEVFSPDNGLLTPTLKLRRHEARLRFQHHIDRMYRELEATQE